MKKRQSILQKKLKELETILNNAVSLPPETPYNHHQLYVQDIEQRFEFVRKLLSAEISSHPKKPYHLKHFALRLTELESTFKEWDSIKALIPVLEHLETVSTCSSCLNDDAKGDGDSDVSPEFYEGSREEEENVEDAIDHGIEKHNVMKKEEGRIRVFVKYFGVMGAGVVMGMALTSFAIVKFSGCFNCVERNTFLVTPT